MHGKCVEQKKKELATFPKVWDMASSRNYWRPREAFRHAPFHFHLGLTILGTYMVGLPHIGQYLGSTFSSQTHL